MGKIYVVTSHSESLGDIPLKAFKDIKKAAMYVTDCDQEEMYARHISEMCQKCEKPDKSCMHFKPGDYWTDDCDTRDEYALRDKEYFWINEITLEE